MKHSFLPKLLVLSLAFGGLLAPAAAAIITIPTVPVGNAGNTNDATDGQGAVAYEYRIGKYEVTLDQYVEFLNAVAATDTYGLYNASMSTDLRVAGISRSGGSGSYTYAVIDSGKRPVTYVSWFDCARFANWLHNGQPTGLQNATTTEQGAYTLNGAMSGILITRNADWKYGLPTESEWYKAAYHQPASAGGDVDGYWRYPTATNAIPNSRNGSASDPNSANFYRNDNIANGFNGGFAVTDNIANNPAQNYLTETNAFSLAHSYYGTFDQAGNVFEWNAAVSGAQRGLRGGSWINNESLLRGSEPDFLVPTFEGNDVGFRIVMASVGAPVMHLSQSGITLTFSWVGNFKLQAQTNSLSVGLSTNWSDYPAGGSSPVILNINPANPAVFFRLSSP